MADYSFIDLNRIEQRASSSDDRSESQNGSDSGRGSTETGRGSEDDFQRQLKSGQETEEVDLSQQNNFNIGMLLIQLAGNCEGQSLYNFVKIPNDPTNLRNLAES